MSDSVRLGALLLCFLGIIFIAYNAYKDSMAEHLDDETLRGLYKMADGFVLKNPKALQDFMQKRFHANYTRNGNLINVVKDKPDQVIPIAQNKQHAIEAAMQSLSMLKLKSYDHKVVEIKRSEDEKFAYVSSTTMSTGTVNIPLPDNKTATVPYNEGSSCIDTLTIEMAEIYFLRSDCTNKIAIMQ